jgi:hypothetical protein
MNLTGAPVTKMLQNTKLQNITRGTYYKEIPKLTHTERDLSLLPMAQQEYC